MLLCYGVRPLSGSTLTPRDNLWRQQQSNMRLTAYQSKWFVDCIPVAAGNNLICQEFIAFGSSLTDGGQFVEVT